jgi:hypothetical protein
MKKRNVLNAIVLTHLLVFAPAMAFAGDCACDEQCQKACAEGKGEKCTCTECDCKKGNCKHGKCKVHKKDKKES